MVKIKIQSSISLKLLFMSLLTGVIVIAIFIFSATHVFNSVFDELYQEKALAITSSINAGVGINDLSEPEKLQNIINKYLFLYPEISFLKVNTLNKNKELRVTASNEISEIGIISNEENQLVFQNENTLTEKVFLKNGDSGFKIIAPIVIGGEKLGTYEIQLTNHSSWISFQEKMVQFLLLVAFFVAIASLLFYSEARRLIILPIKEIVLGIDKLGEGNLSYKFPVKSQDEIGKLAQAFNESSEKISNLYSNMEGMVKERTFDLNLALEKMANSKKAILNILDDAKELEFQLQQEKAGVEKKVEIRTFELSESNARLQSAIDSVPRIFVVFDTNNQIVLHNNKMNTVLQADEKIWTTEKIDYLLGDKIGLEKNLKEVLNTGKLIHIRDYAYQSRFLSIYMGPVILDPTKPPIGTVMTIDDITEKIILERSKDEFFSIASHELRTPLTAIRGNTSMILEYYAESVKEPELKTMIDDIHESSIRLINIVNDFLNVSRLEQSRMVFDLKDTDLQKLIPETIKEYDVTSSRHNLSIDFIAPTKPLPLVLADSDKVRQVLINLLGNAIKFTTKGGITISTEQNDKFIKVLVTDTGRGIPPKQQSLLFHKFQQTGTSLFTRDTAGGSGLGLYISKMMIEGMGGDVVLEKSEEGKGSVFSFTLLISTKENKANFENHTKITQNSQIDKTNNRL